jgi:glutamyl-tRNA reductase
MTASSTIPVMLGIDHRAATLAFRERIAAAVADLPSVMGHLRAHASEAAVLSTCNRTELYLVGAEPEQGVRCLSHVTNTPPEQFADSLAARAGADAASHLFAVAAGLESQLLGETQVLGQVRDAYYAAKEVGGLGPVLGTMFRYALSVGKRARAQTGISRGAASIGSAAADIVKTELPVEARRRALIVGAGEAAERVLAHLQPLRIGRIDIANRTVARAEALVAPPGQALPLDALGEALAGADVAIFAVTVPHPILGRDAARAVMERRAGRPLLLLDLAVPRNVAPGVGEIPGVRLYDVDEVQGRAALAVERRQGEVEAVRALVAAQVTQFEEWLHARRAAAQIVRLRDRAEALRQEEVRRATVGLSERERVAVDRATRAVLRSLLHGPTVALRKAGDPSVADLLAEAFKRTRVRDGVDAAPVLART